MSLRHDERAPGQRAPGQEELVRAAAEGDQAAWNALFHMLYPRLRTYFGRRIGPAYADDAASETMTRAVAALGTFRPTEVGFDGWVFGIARHVSVDHHRRSERQRRYNQTGHVWSPAPSESTPVDQGALDDVDRTQVRAAFALLTAAEQEILELRVIAGLSAEDVGHVLGRRTGAVRTAQSRALAHLRELMGDQRA